ncbi:VWA containing CoxE family protein [Bengtsoniella intestinalis]|uniref:vWA domain-containing protein n=1 Tax=Bengtsoniella intestinalis TaxID=3073143 RepID=UPI00391F52A2
MFTGFFYFLRDAGMQVSMGQWMALMEGMSLGLHDATLTGFYHLCRCTLVKSEAEFDKFDRAFFTYFKDIQSFETLPQAFLDWLNTPMAQREYDKAAVDAQFAGMDLDEIRRMMEQRLKDQHERHDGGNHWIGTGGTSLYGHGGYNPNGIRIGGDASGHQSAVQVAAERKYQDFREDTTLGLRQFQMAFRRLRQLSSRNEGPKDELQLEKSIQATCDNGGYLKLEFDRPRTNDVKLLLLFDSGGSMWRYAQMCNQLFAAANQSNHFKQLRTYYFHNCWYDHLHTTPHCWYEQSVDTQYVLNNLSSDWKVIVVGDGSMAPSELLNVGGCLDYYHYNQESGIEWVRRIRAKFPHMVWLNPVSEEAWMYSRGARSISILRQEVEMYPLSLEGLDKALKRLMATV